MNTKLPVSALLLLLMAAAGLVGCGGDSGTASSQTGPPLSKAEFIKQGNTLCKKAIEEESNVFAKFSSKEEAKPGDLKVSELEAFATDSILPIAQRMIDELSELTPPKADQQTVEQLIAKFEHGMEIAEETPAEFLSGRAFKGPDAAADEYGVTRCGV